MLVAFLMGSLVLWMPAGAMLTVRMLRLGPVEYMPLYGGVTRCFFLMGVAGEFVDLLSRHRLLKELVVHHTIEIIGGGIMIDSSIRKPEPGFLFFVMITVVGRGAFMSLMFDHVSQWEGASDTIFPAWCLSQEGRHRIFGVAGVVWAYSALGLRLQLRGGLPRGYIRDQHDIVTLPGGIVKCSLPRAARPALPQQNLCTSVGRRGTLCSEAVLAFARSILVSCFFGQGWLQ